ncbi:hypothetical protein ABNG30_20875 [Bacillus thuringiensis]
MKFAFYKTREIFSFQGDDPLTKYFNAIFVDGDWQNDWITYPEICVIW